MAPDKRRAYTAEDVSMMDAHEVSIAILTCKEKIQDLQLQLGTTLSKNSEWKTKAKAALAYWQNALRLTKQRAQALGLQEGRPAPVRAYDIDTAIGALNGMKSLIVALWREHETQRELYHAMDEDDAAEIRARLRLAHDAVEGLRLNGTQENNEAA